MIRSFILALMVFLPKTCGQTVQSAKGKTSLFHDTTIAIQNSFKDASFHFNDMTEVVHVIKNELKNSCPIGEQNIDINECQEYMISLTHTAYNNYNQLRSLKKIAGTKSVKTVINVEMEEDTSPMDRALVNRILGVIMAADNLVELENELLNIAWAIERLEESLGSLNMDDSQSGDSSSLVVDCTAMMLQSGLDFFPDARQLMRRNLRSLQEKKEKREKDKDKDKHKDQDKGKNEVMMLENGIVFNVEDAKEVIIETGFACLSNGGDALISALYPALSFADKFLVNP